MTTNNPLLVEASEAPHPPDASEESGLHMNFNGEVAQQFEQKVISNQIPGYETMRTRCLQMIREFLTDDSALIDLGCSTGKSIRDVFEFFDTKGDSRAFSVRYVGIDFEEDMIRVARSLMESVTKDRESEADLFHLVDSGDTGEPHVTFMQGDLRRGFRDLIPYVPASVICSIFTLQFIPMEHRMHLLQDIYDTLAPGGAFIFAEKVLIPNRRIESAMTLAYYDVKSKNGMSDKEIRTKRSKLENYLLPCSTAANLEMLEGAGFAARNVQVIWKDLQFEMYLAVKDG